MQVRLKPFDPDQGHVLRDYSCRGVTFMPGVWREVEPDLGVYLSTVRQRPCDARSALAFDVLATVHEDDDASAEVRARRPAVSSAAATGLSDGLWAQLERRIPRRVQGPQGGRPPVDDRRVLEGIVFVLRTGVGWHRMPSAFGSWMTCWRRLRQWQSAGVWERLQEAMASEPETASIDWSQVTRRQQKNSASFPRTLHGLRATTSEPAMAPTD